jgi:predicted methyltransferase
MKTHLKSGAAALVLAALAACATPPAAEAPPAPAASAPEPAKPAAIDYAALVAAPGRPEADIAADANRKPAGVLAFFSPKPGDTILEIEAGGGYFTELLSRAVGETGKVYMQNPAGFDAFLGDAVSKRIDGRLTNVEYLKSNFDTFALPDASVDIVTWFQGPHELWYKPEGAPEGLGDPDKSFAEIARVLKPGGLLVIIDHVAPAGTPPTSGGDTHRIDPEVIARYARAAGLEYEGDSALLGNPADDGLTNVFDPAIRGKTDQVLTAFSKP